MAHCDPDVLALAAAGEPALAASDVTHLRTCSTCAAELDGSARAVALARGPEPDPDASVQPPPQVWDRVASELELDPRPPVATVRRRARAAPRRRPLLAVAAGVVVLAVGAGLGWTVARPDGDVDVTRPLLAAGELVPLSDGGTGARGVAELVGPDGDRRLEVDLTGLTGTEGYHEVWLIDPSSPDGAMVSLGVLPSTDGVVDLAVPTGLDTTAYSVVDVSDEPYDGDPAHSQVSVARGTLETTG